VQYVFADTDVAERRLGLVAEAFAPATTAFLRDVVPRVRALAVDLGCGPGHTTRLLASVLGRARTVGLDGSPRFIAAARAAGGDPVEFIVHDVTTVPFPTPPADLVYCRFLLSHLRQPAAALARWATQLAPAGLLLVEEVETIDTTLPVFRRYLRIVDEVLAAAGGGCTSAGRWHPCRTPSRSAGGRAAWRRSEFEPQPRHVRAQHSRMARPPYVRAHCG
jgi:SAM-dependent methyltransferase